MPVRFQLVFFQGVFINGMEINPISKETGEHYIWGDQCDGWHLLKSSELSVIQERVPPRTTEVRHFHHRAQQFLSLIHI